MVSKWGTPGWTFLHCVSFTYSKTPTPQERRDMFAFLRSVGNVLPCKKCRSHYNSYVHTRLQSTTSPALQSRESLSRFVVDLHNDVNRRLQRPVIDYETVRRMYEDDTEVDWVGPALAAAVVLCVVAIMVHRSRWASRCADLRSFRSSARPAARTGRKVSLPA